MTYRRVLPMSMVLAVLGSDPTTTLAAFPEHEFSEHELEWRHDRREMRQGRQAESVVRHGRQQWRVDEPHRPNPGQLQQDRQYRRHAGQTLRRRGHTLRADRQNRKQKRHEVRKERRELSRDRQDLRADHRGLRGEPVSPNEGHQ